ncbi:132 kDa protein, partial [Durusdinium trenchii]
MLPSGYIPATAQEALLQAYLGDHGVTTHDRRFRQALATLDDVDLQALTAGPTAPRTQQTLDELRDPSRRPLAPYGAPITDFQPDQPELPTATIVHNLRRSRKGAAGPSGLTADTLRLLLDDEETTTQLATVAQQLANAQVPTSIAAAIGFGRVVALRAIGDVLRHLVARSLAQQHATAIHTTCAPHQFALSTRAGTEAVVRAISVATQSNPQHTVLSVDGIGAYDTISRHSMLHGLMNVPIVNRCLPFVRMFYGQASQYIWRAALQAIQEQLHPNELLLAYLDDVYAVVPPTRVREVYDVMAHELHSLRPNMTLRSPVVYVNCWGNPTSQQQHLAEHTFHLHSAALDAADALQGPDWNPPTWLEILN